MTDQSSTAPVPMSPSLVLSLTDQVDELVGKLDVMEERRRLDRRIWVTGIAIIVALMALMGVMLGGTLYNSHQNQEQLGILRDCLEPNGACFKTGRDRTRGVVTHIEQHQLAVVRCARDPKVITAQQFDSCVELHTRDIPDVK